MVKLQFAHHKKQPLKILCLGAHSDDIEIGCGGTILKLLQDHKNILIYWAVFGANKIRKKEAEQSARALIPSVKQGAIRISEFRDGFFPYQGEKIKESFEDLKRTISPDVIFTHYRSDLHQDHRLISELTWNTFRDQLILEYEILKYDGDLGNPNLFVTLPESIVKRKVMHLNKYFVSQRGNQWFDAETFRSLLRLRGVEANSDSRYAEAFYCRKVVY